jgi:hypothetical protein
MQIKNTQTFMGQIITVDVGDGECDTWVRIAPHEWILLEGFGEYIGDSVLEALYAEYLQQQQE